LFAAVTMPSPRAARNPRPGFHQSRERPRLLHSPRPPRSSLPPRRLPAITGLPEHVTLVSLSTDFDRPRLIRGRHLPHGRRVWRRRWRHQRHDRRNRRRVNWHGYNCHGVTTGAPGTTFNVYLMWARPGQPSFGQEERSFSLPLSRPQCPVHAAGDYGRRGVMERCYIGPLRFG